MPYSASTPPPCRRAGHERNAASMKRRRILLLLALAAVATGLVLFWPRGPKEPVVEGRRFTDWAKAAMRNSTLPDEKACTALRGTAADSLPFLLLEFTRPR